VTLSRADEEGLKIYAEIKTGQRPWAVQNLLMARMFSDDESHQQIKNKEIIKKNSL